MSTQTTVSFLTFNPTAPAGDQYTSAVRVFSLDISQEAQSVYLEYMNQLQSYMNNGDVAGMGTILQALDTWSQYQYVQNGQQTTLTATIPDPANPGGTLNLSDLGTMNRYMAQDIDTLEREFNAAGYDPVNSNPSTTPPTYVFTQPNVTTIGEVANQLFGVSTASLYNVAGSITQAISDAQQASISGNAWSDQSSSIQQLLMVDYISTGNDILYGEMSQLNSAIDLNSNALTYLNSLQDLMNQKTPQQFVLALQDLSGTVGQNPSTYSQFEQDSFNQNLQNVADFSDSDISAYLTNILGLNPDSTTPPTTSQTAGTALGAFQALSPDYLTDTLNQYLSGQGLTSTNMTSLMPALSDNPTFATPLSTFATDNSLSASDQQLIWQTFLTQEAGTNLPSSLCTSTTDSTTGATTLTDVVNTDYLSAFNTYLGELGNVGNTMSTTMNDQLMSDAGVSSMDAFSTLYPSQMPSSAIENEIASNFTSYNLTDQQTLNILQAFLVKEGAVQGLAPSAIDMTVQSNLDALGAYAQSVSNTAALPLTQVLQTYIDQPLAPSSTLTFLENQLVSDAGVSSLADLSNLYPPNLTSLTAADSTPLTDAQIASIESEINTNFTACTLTDDDTLNIVRSFLVQQGAAQGVAPSAIDMTQPSNLNALGAYAQTLSNEMPSPTEIQLMSDAGVSSLSALSSLYPPEVALLPSSQIESDINTNFTAYTLTSDDTLNIFRAFLVQQGTALGVAPTAVDMTQQSNLNALVTYTQSLSNQASQSGAQLSDATLDDLGMDSMYPPIVASTSAWNTLLNTIETVWNGNYFSTSTPMDATTDTNLQLALTQYVFQQVSGTSLTDININDPGFLSTATQLIETLAIKAETNGVPSEAQFIENLPSYGGYPPNFQTFDWYTSQISTTFANAPFSPLSADDERRIIQAFVQKQGLSSSTDFNSSTVQSEFTTYLGTLPQTSYSALVNQIASDSGVLTNLYPPANLISNSSIAISTCTPAFSFLSSWSTSDKNSAILSVLQAYGAVEQQVQGTDPQNLDISSDTSDFSSFVATLASDTTTNPPANLAAFQNVICQSLLYDQNITLTPAQLSASYPTTLIPGNTLTTIVNNNFTAFPLTSDETSQLIEAAIAHIAATNDPPLSPQDVDLNNSTVQSQIATYVANLSSNSTSLQSILAKDAGTTNLASLQPPTLAGWDDISSIITSAFSGTATTLSPTDEMNILRAFLVTQASALSTPSAPVTAEDVDMADPKNIAAFTTYVVNLADQTGVMPVSDLTSLPDINVNQYSALLDAQFSTANGYTTTDQLNVWQAFLVSQGLTTDTSLSLGVGASTAAFTSFLDGIAPYVGSSTGANLVNGLYAYLGTQSQGVPTLGSSSFPTIAELTSATPPVGYPSDSGLVTDINDSIQSNGFPSTTYSSTDDLNIWRAYMIYNGDTTPDDYSTANLNGLTTFLQNLKAQIGSTPVTGGALVNVLNVFALCPPGLASLAETYLPSPTYSEADQANFMEGLMDYSGVSSPSNSQAAATCTSMLPSYLKALGFSESSPPPTGQALVNLIDSSLYQQAAAGTNSKATLLTSLTSVTQPPQPTTISQYMNSILGSTTPLTSAEEVQVWDAFLASNAGNNSIMKTNIMDAATMTKFDTFLTSVSQSDLGSAIDTRMARIISNLQYIIDSISQVDSGSSVASQLQLVLNDFQSLQQNKESITTWVEDSQSGAVGNYQNDLNNAIVASQGLNDTERENLQNVMFVYEEFYKSATSMLSDLNDLLVKIAQAINGA